MAKEEEIDTEGEALLDAKKMDGPTVGWAPNDILTGKPRAFLTYHVMSSGYDYLTPLGTTIGGVISMTPLKQKLFPRLTPLQVAGSVGFASGVLGMALGLAAMYGISKKPNPKIPFTDEGIQMRVDGLKHNYMVRVMDLGVTGGLASAGGLMLVLGGPTSLGLSAGTLGMAQGIGLGSAVGSFASIGYINATKDT